MGPGWASSSSPKKKNEKKHPKGVEGNTGKKETWNK